MSYWGHTTQKVAADKTWADAKCCMPRQNCASRKEMISFKNDSNPDQLVLPVLEIFDLSVVLGNVNMIKELYRTCSLSLEVNDVTTACP